MHRAIVTPASQAYTGATSKRKRENMETGLDRSRTGHSLCWCLPQLEAWVERLRCFTNVLQTKYPKRRKPPTARQWYGLDAPSPSPFCDRQWCASEATAQCLIEYPMLAYNSASQRAGSPANSRLQSLHIQWIYTCNYAQCTTFL